MFDSFSDGYCPQCLLDDQNTPMAQNTRDFWECPTCRLQARSGGGVLVILRTRGDGRLRENNTKATSFVVGWFLGKADSDDPFHGSSPFDNEAELREFLSTQVH